MSLLKPIIVSILFFLFSCALYFFHKYLWGFGLLHTREHPYQYILLASCSLLITDLFFHASFIKNTGFKGKKQKFYFLITWAFIMEISGAFLWSYHDMGDSNYTARYASFIEKAIFHDLALSIQFGTLFLLTYFPYNLICLSVLNFLINKVYKLKSIN